jgi:hypothetical protein
MALEGVFLFFRAVILGGNSSVISAKEDFSMWGRRDIIYIY